MAHGNRWFTVLNSMVGLSMAMLNNQIVTLVAGAIISVKNQIIV
jgi:hypothetical protein